MEVLSFSHLMSILSTYRVLLHPSYLQKVKPNQIQPYIFDPELDPEAEIEDEQQQRLMADAKQTFQSFARSRSKNDSKH